MNLNMATTITRLANQNANFTSLVCGELVDIRGDTRSNTERLDQVTERLDQVTERLEQATESSKKMQIQLDALQRNHSINQTGIIEGRNLFGDSSHNCKY
jgi:septal ring factor EnvC (AmiA/AmiB activator)